MQVFLEIIMEFYFHAPREIWVLLLEFEPWSLANGISGALWRCTVDVYISFVEAEVEGADDCPWSKSHSEEFLIVDFKSDIVGSSLYEIKFINGLQTIINYLLWLESPDLQFQEQLNHEISIFTIVPLVKRKMFEFLIWHLQALRFSWSRSVAHDPFVRHIGAPSH